MRTNPLVSALTLVGASLALALVFGPDRASAAAPLLEGSAPACGVFDQGEFMSTVSGTACTMDLSPSGRLDARVDARIALQGAVNADMIARGLAPDCPTAECTDQPNRFGCGPSARYEGVGTTVSTEFVVDIPGVGLVFCSTATLRANTTVLIGCGQCWATIGSTGTGQ